MRERYERACLMQKPFSKLENGKYQVLDLINVNHDPLSEKYTKNDAKIT